MRTVPFNDLTRRTERNRAAIDRAIRRVVDSGWYLLGPETTAFEEEWARYCGASGCVAVANGTDALEVALRAVGCTAGDEVILAPNAGNYGTIACRAIGAIPVYADVGAEDLLLDPTSVARVAGPRCRALIATHLYGHVADVGALRAAAPGVAVIEDGAQAHGARRHGRRVGSLGDIAAFSFYPTKNLGALGDGGAVVSSSPELLARARQLHQYGWSDRYRTTLVGGRNSRMDEMQAAVLRAMLVRLDEDNVRRRTIIDHYRDALGSDLALIDGPIDTYSVGHLCVVRTPERDRVQAALAADGIATAVHYPLPDHHQPAQQGAAFRSDDLPVTEQACTDVLSVPCFPELTDEEVDLVARGLEALGG